MDAIDFIKVSEQEDLADHAFAKFRNVYANHLDPDLLVNENTHSSTTSQLTLPKIPINPAKPPRKMTRPPIPARPAHTIAYSAPQLKPFGPSFKPSNLFLI